MSTFLTSTELPDQWAFMWAGDTVGDEIENTSGISVAHPTMLVQGAVDLWIDGSPQGNFTAPHIFDLPLNTAYKFKSTVAETTVLCVYNRLIEGTDEMLAHLISNEPIYMGQ